MRTLVIYDSKFGNTEQIALAIARGAGTHGSVRVASVEEAAVSLAERPDLYLIGGPTQRRGMSPGLQSFVGAIAPGSLSGIRAATFDTRYRGSTWIMGSAATEAAKRLQKVGARLEGTPESFFIDRGGPLEKQQLAAGELARAEAWGRDVVGREGGAR
jgi:flavodoxin